jgi:hypothetical protein
MNKSSLHRAILIASLLATFGSLTVHAAAPEACCAVPMSDKAATTPPAAAAPYPLTTCVVSGEPLEGGDMGGPVNYTHKEDGKPDRLVRFCCSGCIKKFKNDPAKYLAKLDAAAAKAELATPAKPADAAAAHSHLLACPPRSACLSCSSPLRTAGRQPRPL